MLPSGSGCTCSLRRVGELAAGPFRIPAVDLSSIRLDSAGLCALAVILLVVMRRGLFETLGVVTAAGLAVGLLSP